MLSALTRWITTTDYRTILLHACGCVTEGRASDDNWHPIAQCAAHRSVWVGSGWED
jgi:hypothetical protein